MTTTKKATTKITMATAKKMWAKVIESEIKAASKFRAQRAEIVRKLSVAGFSDTAICNGLGISIGEVGKLLGAGLASKIGNFDILATLDAIGTKGSKVTAANIKGIANNTKLKRDEKAEALVALGLVANETRAARKARTNDGSNATDKDVKTIKAIVERAKTGKTNINEIWTILQDSADALGNAKA